MTYTSVKSLFDLCFCFCMFDVKIVYASKNTMYLENLHDVVSKGM